MNYQEKIRSVKDYIRLPLCYNHWFVAGLKEEFDQKPPAKTLLERSIVFYRTEAGELVAMQNRCLTGCLKNTLARRFSVNRTINHFS